MRIGSSGVRSTYSFCPLCGITVYYQSDAERDLLAIPAGAFADPAFPAPVKSYYQTRRCPWVDVRLRSSAAEPHSTSENMTHGPSIDAIDRS
jgi:hypothetical protein